MRLRNASRQDEFGFTLVELTVSVAVLSVMTLAIYPLFRAAQVTYGTDSAAFTVIQEAQRGLDRMKEDILQTQSGTVIVDNRGYAIAFPVNRVKSPGGGLDIDWDGLTDAQEGIYDAGPEMVLNPLGGGLNEGGWIPCWKGVAIYAPFRLDPLGQEGQNIWQLRKYVITASELGLGGFVDNGINDLLPLDDVQIIDVNGRPNQLQLDFSDGTTATINMNNDSVVGGGRLIVTTEVIANYLSTRDEDDPGFVAAQARTTDSLRLQFNLRNNLIEVLLPLEKAPEMRLRRGFNRAATERNTIEAVLRTSIEPRVYS